MKCVIYTPAHLRCRLGSCSIRLECSCHKFRNESCRKFSVAHRMCEFLQSITLKPSLIGQQIIFEADRVSMECVILTSNHSFGSWQGSFTTLAHLRCRLGSCSVRLECSCHKFRNESCRKFGDAR
ncbi:hypothetical protein CDAR_579461 [Caerostris darwini]|uniref:Uncharacterized protein n=1 Tax=Caerostris darwini TaxID=1538125 RepID=A0AAV4V2Q1_9ARAC|nr:hypothetical protein CDAR_579461 [Caerostris darwini]